MLTYLDYVNKNIIIVDENGSLLYIDLNKREEKKYCIQFKQN